MDDIVFLFFAAAAAFAVVVEAGFRLGRRYSDPADRAARDHVGALQAASLGLLALLLGFTFAMAVSRYDARKALVLDEANAIGTTYLRAGLLPAAQQEEIRKLLKSYVAARLEFYEARVDASRLAAAGAAAARIEGELWKLAGSAVALDARSVPAGLFVQSLNELIDLNEKRRVALDNRVPAVVLYLLYAVSVGALGFIAYGYGLAGRRRHGSTMAFALLVAMVLTVILDLDRPRRGLILVSQESMLRLKASLDQDKP